MKSEAINWGKVLKILARYDGRFLIAFLDCLNVSTRIFEDSRNMENIKLLIFMKKGSVFVETKIGSFEG